MPWKEKNAMDLKTEFILKSLDRNISFNKLCKEYGISSTTGYKWKNRFMQFGLNGLHERSRKPHTNPNQVTEDVVCEIIRIKNAHKNWGGKKIRELYGNNHPYEKIPSVSTFNRILDKAGLVKHRKRRHRKDIERIHNMIKAENTNDIWTVDFKGWWYTPDSEKCEPLTVRDHYSKYIFSIKLLNSCKTSDVKEEFKRLFKKYGLPKVIRSDNGSPFASGNSVLGLTRLSVWWLSLGIQLDRIRPGKPSDNGSHERMHRDIKMELHGQISGGIREHQAAFNIWKDEYNCIRPHETLGMKTPESVYSKSEIKYEGDVDEIIYPVGYMSRKVNSRGYLSFDKKRIFIGYAFQGYNLGLRETSYDMFDVWFDNLLIGKLDLKVLSLSSSEELLFDQNEEKCKLCPEIKVSTMS